MNEGEVFIVMQMYLFCSSFLLASYFFFYCCQKEINDNDGDGDGNGDDDDDYSNNDGSFDDVIDGDNNVIQ